jgi:hypothetical protein
MPHCLVNAPSYAISCGPDATNTQAIYALVQKHLPELFQRAVPTIGYLLVWKPLNLGKILEMLQNLGAGRAFFSYQPVLWINHDDRPQEGCERDDKVGETIPKRGLAVVVIDSRENLPGQRIFSIL